MNQPQRVKICGISDLYSAEVAAFHADYIGIVFYPGSHRYVQPEEAGQIVDKVRQVSPEGRTKLVGLFVNEPVELVHQVWQEAGLDMVQLSGSEPGAYMDELATLGVPFIATVRAGDGQVDETIARFDEITSKKPYAVHLDTHVPGMWGGSGVVGDWKLASKLARKYRLFLAGGLDPENVKKSVAEVQPFAVDVSSGVETNKKKDHSKIRAFIAAARGIDGEKQ